VTPESIDGDLLVAMLVFVSTLAVLAGAILIIQCVVRRRDVLHGGFIERDDDGRSG
jgi:hypothetical protein